MYIGYIFPLILIYSVNFVRAQPLEVNELSMGIRSYTMGKTSGILFSEPSAVILNPAVVNHERLFSFSAYYSNYASDQQAYNLAGYVPLKHIGDIALAYQNFSVGDLQQVGSDFEILSAFSFTAEQITLAYANTLAGWLTAGISGKWYHSYYPKNQSEL